MSEMWRPIQGYEGMYEVSDAGQVRSVPREIRKRRGGSLFVTARTLRPARSKRGGYLMVQLHRLGDRKLRTIHSLVADAFIGPRPAGCDVCHSDGDPLNNAAVNLRYGTRPENIADTARHGRIPSGTSHWNAKVAPEQAAEIRARYARGAETMRLIADSFGVSVGTIHRLVHQKGAE